MGLFRWRSDQRGTSSLEFIVVLPTLLFLLFAIIELSRAWFTLNLATTAAREGARYGAVAGTGAATGRIDQILGAGNWTGSVVCLPAPCAPDSVVQATVSVTFQTVVPTLLPILNGVQISQTASMRYE